MKPWHKRSVERAFDYAHLPLMHTRCPLTCSRTTAALALACAFAGGVAAAAWFVLLVKGGAL